MKHVELAAGIESALVVFVDALEGVLDTSKVRNTSVNSLKQLHHGQECTIEGWDVVVVEGQFGSTGSDLLAILHEFLYTANLGEWRCHGTDAPCTYLLSVLGQHARVTHAT